MLYALLTVARPVEGEAVARCPRLLDIHQHRAASQLTGQLSVSEASLGRGLFDTVQLRFRGIILSLVGGTSAIEDIITLTDVKPVSDFHPSNTPSSNESERVRHVDFYFELPTKVSTSDGVSRSLPLSTIIAGSTDTSTKGAINGPQVVRGDCEVSYWVEARFCLGGNEVAYLSEDVKISSLYPGLRASLPRGEPVTLRAKPDLLARWRLQKRPTLDIALYEPDMMIQPGSKSARRQMTLPIAVTMDIQPPAAGSDSIDARQSFKCSVEAKWEVHTRFSTVSMQSSKDGLMRGDTISKTTLASTQKSTIFFRPLPHYNHHESLNAKVKLLDSYAATSQLDLHVPDTVSQPTLRWKHLTRTYTLQLSLNFHGLPGAPRYSVHSKIPLSVSATSSRTDDSQKDGVIISICEAGDSQDLDDDIHDARTLLLADQILAEKRIEMMRMPPPLYFR